MEKPIILIIGRFQPFHLGHLEIIKKYSNKGYFIKIGIGSSETIINFENPFDSKEREIMIESSLKEQNIKNFKIFLIPDTDDEVYVNHVFKIVGNFNVLFTGNLWTKDLFSKKQNYEIHSFNEKTERINGISATKIREKWLKEESIENLPNEVFKFLKQINARERLNRLKNAREISHFQFFI